MNTAAPDPPLPHKIYYNDLIILNILNIISFVSRLDDLKSVMVVDKWGFQAAAAKAYEDRDEVEREAWPRSVYYHRFITTLAIGTHWPVEIPFARYRAQYPSLRVIRFRTPHNNTPSLIILYDDPVSFIRSKAECRTDNEGGEQISEMAGVVEKSGAEQGGSPVKVGSSTKRSRVIGKLHLWLDSSLHVYYEGGTHDFRDKRLGLHGKQYIFHLASLRIGPGGQPDYRPTGISESAYSATRSFWSGPTNERDVNGSIRSHQAADLNFRHLCPNLVELSVTSGKSTAELCDFVKLAPMLRYLNPVFTAQEDGSCTPPRITTALTRYDRCQTAMLPEGLPALDYFSVTVCDTEWRFDHFPIDVTARYMSLNLNEAGWGKETPKDKVLPEDEDWAQIRVAVSPKLERLDLFMLGAGALSANTTGKKLARLIPPRVHLSVGPISGDISSVLVSWRKKVLQTRLEYVKRELAITEPGFRLLEGSVGEADIIGQSVTAGGESSEEVDAACRDLAGQRLSG